MTKIVEKLVLIAREIIAEKRKINLFALFLPEDPAHRWHVVLSAPWATPDKGGAIHYIGDKITSYLKASERRQIGRIVILEKIPPALLAQAPEDHASVGVNEYGPFVAGEVFVSRAIVLVLKRPHSRKTNKMLV